MRIRFLKSAEKAKDWPPPDLPEVALAGRSNAGKSSFLDALGNERVAKVSQKPGKTRLLNFFGAGPHYRFVDMPGYGYSSRSGDEQASWGPMIETYLQKRSNLKGVLLFMDIRRDWGDDEQMLIDWLERSGKPVALVLTRADKLNRKELLARERYFHDLSQGAQAFFISSLKKTGLKEVETFIFENWVKA